MQLHSLTKLFVHASCTTLALLSVAASAAAQNKQTITAVAEVKSADGATASAPVTIVIDRFASDADRAALVKAVKSGGTESVRQVLAKRSDVGTLKLGSNTAAVKYAYVRELGDGQLITAITSEPLGFLGAGKPGAKPTKGFDLGLVLIELSGKGTGTGELVPAGAVRIGDQDSIVTEAYNSADTVRLTNVVRK
jgi:hypothetical protein